MFISVPPGDETNDWWLNAIHPLTLSLPEDTSPSPSPGPEQIVFLSENCTKVTAQTGSTSVLHCEVGGVTESMVRVTITHHF